MTESRKRKIGVALTMGLVQAFTIAGVLTLGVVAYQQSDRAAVAAEQAAAAEDAAAVEAAQRGQDIEALRDQVYELGETPVVAPPSPVPTSPSTVPRNGRDGEDGEDAPAPTAAQMLAAVQQCFTSGLCVAPEGDVGPAGTNGTNGTDGRDGTNGSDGAPGAAGPPCPQGFTPATVWLSASDAEIDIPTTRQAVICLPTPIEGEPSS